MMNNIVHYMLLNTCMDKNKLDLNAVFSYHYCTNDKFRIYINSYVRKNKLKLNAVIYSNKINNKDINMLHSLYKLYIKDCYKINDVGSLKYVNVHFKSYYVYGLHLIKNLNYIKIYNVNDNLKKINNQHNKINKFKNTILLNTKKIDKINDLLNKHLTLLYCDIMYIIRILLFIVLICFENPNFIGTF